MILTIPIRLFSEANIRCHWAVRAKRVKKQREAVAWACSSWEAKEAIRLYKAHLAVTGGAIVVTLTRVAPRPLDSDNNQRAGKGVRDEIAKQLGVDDADKRIEWKYFQERGKPKEYSVRICIEVQP